MLSSFVSNKGCLPRSLRFYSAAALMLCLVMPLPSPMKVMANLENLPNFQSPKPSKTTATHAAPFFPVQETPLKLAPSIPMEQEIMAGQTLTYLVSLETGQFARISVEQLSIDVTVSLAKPDGTRIVEGNLVGIGGRESFSCEATSAGNYRLTIRTTSIGPSRGVYRLQAEVMPTTTLPDKQRMAAERLMVEAEELRPKKAEAAQQIIDKHQQALTLWRGLNDLYWSAYSLLFIGTGYNELNLYEEAIGSLEQAQKIGRAHV